MVSSKADALHLFTAHNNPGIVWCHSVEGPDLAGYKQCIQL